MWKWHCDSFLVILYDWIIMTVLTKKIQTNQTLHISICPCCNGDVLVRDCGYSSFNPGTAKCAGECKKEWKLGYVDDEFDAGKRWNVLAKSIKDKLGLLKLITVNRVFSISRDFYREEQEDKAEKLLEDIKNRIIENKL